MMSTTKWTWTVALVAALFAGPVLAQPPAVPAAPAGLVQVVVEGTGYDKLSAVNAAFRNAIEQAAGAFLKSQTEVKDFVVTRDIIVAKSAGYVKQHEIIEGPKVRKLPTGELVWVKCRCWVATKPLKDDWLGVQMVLKQVGRPKIMVMIVDRVDGMMRDESYVQAQLEQELIKSGFELVSKEALSALEQKKLLAARIKGDEKAIMEMAQKFKAQAYIVGTVTARFIREFNPGIRMWEYSIGSIVKVYETNTGRLMGTVALPNQIVSDRGDQTGAANSGLVKVAKKFAPAMKYQTINYWYAMSDPRQGQDIVLEVGNMTFSKHRAVLKALRNIDVFNEANGEFGTGKSTFTIKSTVAVNDAAVKIDDLRFGKTTQYKIEISAMRGNRIVAEWKEAEF